MTQEESLQIDTGTEELLARVQDGVAILTLNRPKQRNALTGEMLSALGNVLRDLATDAEIGCLLLTGAGNAFCAGGDVHQLLGQGSGPASAAIAAPSGNPEAGVRALQRLQSDVALTLYELSVPTVAALPGAAAGAGLSLALACDLRIASQQAMMTTAFAKMGLSGDFGGSWLLTQLVGSARARELYLLSERIDAATCERLGLVNRLVAHDRLQDEALAMATALARGPRLAFAHMKQNLHRALQLDFRSCLDAEAIAMRRTQQTADHREAATAFLEKREPRFRGR
jgi:enoyl-CoA hydratase/carnithine racemase